MIQVGPYEVQTLIAERFRLDGGAMFGMIPRAIWQRLTAPDDRHRILMVTRVMLIKSPGRTILVDLGCGEPASEKERDIYAIEPTHPDGIASLATKTAGETITDIIVTHLHFDHVGGVSFIQNGEHRLNFPNATHHLQREHWEYAQAPHLRERGAFPEPALASLKQANLNLIDGEQELFPGVTLKLSSGHTPAMQHVSVSDQNTTIAFPIDLVPTAHHLPAHYGMGYDQCAKQTTDEKQLFLSQAEAGSWIVAFCHDPDTVAATIGRDKHGRYAVKERIEALGT